ncbi:MAG: hypothetical protein KDC54_20740, partial [Lewinella sp.]|nr:hypothetical protein [Lewinella sp.]
YDEFRRRSLEVLGLCCPDSRLFPRHLMLANLGVEPPGYDYRHSFVPSPLFTRQLGALNELRSLFRRIVLLIQNLELPPNVGSFTGIAGITGITSVADITGLTTTTPVLTEAPGLGNLSGTVNFPGTINVPGAVSTPRITRLTNSPSVVTNFNRITANLTTVLNRGNLTAFRPRLVTEIKITPSKLASPLSEKAIPYHYRPIPLYEAWNYQFSRQGKARENLGYRSTAWNSTDDFVRFPLNYELEPFNFLRVEGHIGQNFVAVLAEVLSQKDRFRLPIDVVALKTGRNADNIPLPEEVEECHFQDLEALYDSLREELVCRICETVMRLYNTPILTNEEVGGSQTFLPQLTFLRNCAPNFRYRVDTVGQLYENNLSQHTAAGPSFANVPFSYAAHTYYIFHLVRLAESLSDTVSTLDFATFSNRYATFFNIVRAGNDFLLNLTNDEINTNVDIYPGVDLEELQDQLDMLLYSCKLEPIQSVWEEYQRRLEKVREGLLLSNFARKHPGLTHKAGVPIGGTLVLVYHGENQQGDTNVQTGRFVLRGRVTVDGEVLPGISIFVGSALGTTTDMDGNFVLIVNELPVVLRLSLAGLPTREILVTDDINTLVIDLNDPDAGGSPDRFPELAVGAVIADFYLPYLCCSDCQPVQFVLPKVPPSFSWEQVGCTDPNFGGTIMIDPTGGTPPYEVTTDEGQTWTELGDEPINANHGAVVRIRDAEGQESTARTIQLAQPLTLDPGAFECSEDGSSYTVEIYINGGRPPYRLIQGETSTVVPANQPGLATFASGQGGEVLIQDSSDPACQQTVTIEAHECDQGCGLPCDGITMECGYPFWLQRNGSNQLQYNQVEVNVVNFQVIGESPTQAISFNAEQRAGLTEILSPNGSNFNNANSFSQFWTNRIPSANEFIQSILQGTFGTSVGTILTLGYDPNTLDRFTMLRIERYACYQFVLELEVKYFGNSAKQAYSRFWHYDNAGAAVREVTDFSGQVQESEAEVPVFNCIRRDRCNPDVPPTQLCQQPFEFNAFDEMVNDAVHMLFVQPDAVAANGAILWDVQQGQPGIGKSSPFQTRVLPGANAPNRARVLVVNPETGCAAAREIVLKQG